MEKEIVDLFYDFEERRKSSSSELEIQKLSSPACFYGAGKLGKMALDLFSEIKRPDLVSAFIDRDNSKTSFYGHPIFSLDNLSALNLNQKIVICVALDSYEAIVKQLNNLGFFNLVSFYDLAEAYIDEYPLFNGWKVKKLSEEDKKGILKIYLNLDNQVSRDNYLHFLNWRMLKREFPLKEIDFDSKYKIQEVRDFLGNVKGDYIDVGAYDGEAGAEVLRTFRSTFTRAYFFEPDQISFSKINLKNLQNEIGILLEKKQVALSNYLGNYNFFETGGFSSKLHSIGRKTCQVMTLDSLNLKPALIKYHIEGEELNAIKGSLDTINKNRPVVMFTSYHNEDGLYRLPLFCLDHFKNYKMYFRVHSWQGNGAVFYFVPLNSGDNIE